MLCRASSQYAWNHGPWRHARRSGARNSNGPATRPRYLRGDGKAAAGAKESRRRCARKSRRPRSHESEATCGKTQRRSRRTPAKVTICGGRLISPQRRTLDRRKSNGVSASIHFWDNPFFEVVDQRFAKLRKLRRVLIGVLCRLRCPWDVPQWRSHGIWARGCRGYRGPIPIPPGTRVVNNPRI